MANGVLDVGMAEQYLHRSQVSSCLADERSLCSTPKMGAVLALIHADRRNPFVDQPSTLPRVELAESVHPAGKEES